MKPMLRVPSTRLLPAAAALAVLATAACGTTSAPGAGSSASAASTAVGAATPRGTDASAAPGGSGGPAEATGEAGDVRLVAAVAPGKPKRPGIAAAPGLLVEYSLTNSSASPVTAYDVVPASLGSATLPADVDQEHAWVYAQDGSVRVSKQGFDTAPNVRFAAAPVIGARSVPAGGTLTGTVFLPKPLALDVPGADFTAPRQALPAGAGSFTFCVQVGAAAQGMRPSAAVQGVLEAPVAAPQGDALVCTTPLTVPVS